MTNTAADPVVSMLKPTQPDGIPPGFQLKPDGVYKGPHRICSRICVVALTRTPAGDGWGSLVEVTDPDGRAHRWTMPHALLAGDGSELIRTLRELGLELAPDRGSERTARKVVELLDAWRPTARARTVSRLGWTDDQCKAFVLGDGRVIGEADAGEVVVHTLDGAGGSAADLRASGTLEQWRDQVAARCIGNPLLMLGVSAALAGPVLELLGKEGGGLHFRGASSRGKSSILAAAVSVWGAPGALSTWRATANGLEGKAAASNGTLLALDELGEIDAREAGAAAYMLANGAGKTRADRTGRGRQVVRWRVMLLSSGELGLADKLAEAGAKSKAGQEVRLLDIVADARAHGAFDALHEARDGSSFADALKRATAAAFGVAGPAFVEHLVCKGDAARDALRDAMQRFELEAARTHKTREDGQTARAASRLAVIAAAGECATAWGLTGWTKGAAHAAAMSALGLWLEGRGGAGSHEEREAIRRTRAFLAEEGLRRFEVIGAGGPMIAKRAGWRRGDTFYIHGAAWAEIHKGADRKRAAEALVRAGYLTRGEAGHLTVKAPAAVPGRPRVYVVSADILGADDFA